MAAFILRALIPVGYMADVGAAAKGVFKIIVCSSAGSKMLALDANGKELPGQTLDHSGQPCAFSGLAGAVLPGLDFAPISTPEFVILKVVPRLAVQLPPARAGPQLGARGPPQVS